MNSITASVATFICAFGGALIGWYFCGALPERHLNKDAREVIKMGGGLMATLAALVLGLLISSAKSSFDSMNNNMVQSGTKVILLDRVLAHYGSDKEVKAIREELRGSVQGIVKIIWSGGRLNETGLRSLEATVPMENIQEKLRSLSPQNDSQRMLRSQALNISNELLQFRWLVVEEAQIPLPSSFFVVLLFWLTVLFASISLLAPRNATIFVVVLVCALSVSGAMFLIYEMNRPLTGLVKVSSAPMMKVLEHLGK